MIYTIKTRMVVKTWHVPRATRRDATLASRQHQTSLHRGQTSFYDISALPRSPSLTASWQFNVAEGWRPISHQESHICMSSNSLLQGAWRMVVCRARTGTRRTLRLVPSCGNYRSQVWDYDLPTKVRYCYGCCCCWDWVDADVTCQRMFSTGRTGQIDVSRVTQT